MSRSVPLLRGSWVRRRLLLPFALLVLVVSATLVTALALEDTRTAVRVCLPLLVLATAGLPGLGSELAEARRAELGIAAVRGLHGTALGRLVLPEPLLALLLGALTGNLLGAGAARAMAHTRGLRLDSSWTSSGVLAQLVVLLVLLAGLAIGARGQSRRPLYEQISVVVRRRPASTTLAFAALLVLAAAALAGYRSRTGATADDDWLVAAGPALSALVAGAVTLGALGVLARLTPGSGSTLARWLATRSMARRRDRSRGQVLGVAAVALALFALLAAASVGAWVGENSRLRNGAPLRIPVSMGGLAALQLTHQVDPGGRWLMAAQVSSDSNDPTQRLVLLDTARYDRVAGPTLAHTPAAGLAALLGKLQRGPSVPLGDGPGLSVNGQVVDGPLPRALLLRLDHVDAAGAFQGDQVRVPVAPTGSFGWSGRLTDCAHGCAPTALGVQPSGANDPVKVHFEHIEVGGVEIAGLEWASDETGYAEIFDKDSRVLRTPSGGGLDLSLSSRGFGLTLARSDLPVATSGRATTSGESSTLPGTGGALRRPVAAGHVPALPFVSGGGVLADLPHAALGAGPTPVSAQVYVLARDDTPASVLRRVPGADAAMDLDAAAADLRAASDAGRATVYVGAALAAVLVGLAQLLAQSARTAESRRRERADLRRVGVPDRVLTRARRLELLTTLATGAVVAVAGALLAWWLFGDTLALLDPPAFTPAPTRGGLW